MIPCSREDLVLGGGVKVNEAVLACKQILKFFLLKHVWKIRNVRIFENKPGSLQYKDVVQDIIQALLEIGSKMQTDDWKETLARVCNFQKVLP